MLSFFSLLLLWHIDKLYGKVILELCQLLFPIWQEYRTITIHLVIDELPHKFLSSRPILPLLELQVDTTIYLHSGSPEPLSHPVYEFTYECSTVGKRIPPMSMPLVIRERANIHFSSRINLFA